MKENINKLSVKKLLSYVITMILIVSLSVCPLLSVSGYALESTGNSAMDAFINDSRWTNGASYPYYQAPKLASYQSSGCCSYCADYVRYCYGNNNPRSGSIFYNVNEIRAGDVLTVGNQSNGTGHWFVCLKRSGNRLYVAEGNCSNKVRIGWNYTISGSKFAEDSRSFTAGYHYLSGDTTPPSYDDFKVCEFTDGRFTAYAHVTDPSGVKSVRYAVWTEKNGQDDLIWYNGNHTDGNGYYWIHVFFSEHKNEKGNYIIHMYVCDNAGNEKSVGTSYVFTDKGPGISDVQVSDVSASGYTVKCTVKATSEMGVARVQFPTWTVKNNQDDIASEWPSNKAVRGTISGNTVTFRVNASAHNNETGLYATHIYAFDKIGNATSIAVPTVNVHNHNWNSGTVTKAATCAATGEKTLTCTVCSQTKTEVIPKTAHTPAAAVQENKKASTCTEKGSYEAVVYCSACGAEISREAKSTDFGSHTPVTVRENEVAATCAHSGSYEEVVYCAVCDKELSREQKQSETAAHNYTSKVTAPTCTALGYTTYTCADCGHSYISDYVPMTEHVFKDVVTEPTTKTQGYTTHVCENCGYSYVDSTTEIVPNVTSFLLSLLKQIKATVIIKSDTNEYSLSLTNLALKLTSIKKDCYRIYTKQKNSLVVCVGELDIRTGKYVDTNAQIPVGNVNGDDTIDVSDLSVLLQSDVFGAANNTYDLNIADISVALSAHNYGQCSAEIV